jgi:hypothetical protein
MQASHQIQRFGRQDLPKTGVLLAKDLQALGQAIGCVHGGKSRRTET